MKRTGIALLSAAALLAAGGVSAGEMDGGSDISWTYGQVGFVKPDGSSSSSSSGFGGGISGNGYDVAGSIGISKHWHAGARWNSLNVLSDTGFNDFTLNTWGVSGGFNTGLTTNSQAYFDLGYLESHVLSSGDGAEGNVHGVNLTAGLRYKPVPAVELGAALTYAERQASLKVVADQHSHDTSINLSGQYFIFPAWSLGAAVDFNGGNSVAGEVSDVFTLFTRYSFGYRFSR